MSKLGYAELMTSGWDMLISTVTVCMAVAFMAVEIVLRDVSHYWPSVVNLPYSIRLAIAAAIAARLVSAFCRLYFTFVVSSEPTKHFADLSGERKIFVNWESDSEGGTDSD